MNISKSKKITNWQIIEDLGWGTKSTDCKKLGQYLRRIYPNHFDDVEKFVRNKQKILKKELDDWAEKHGDKRTYWGMGDDSFDDLTAHIVGLGKNKYSEIMKYPPKAKDIKYEESFIYVFHYC